ncbi:SGNH/GDSL hydrolase family protein [uncultured Sphingomonas sp.]|uniref:SGNH/GDSL hydrolase family protein n=1 Tax=uncultured Sphingomonas sp. TaxID=158754 RepID=UPI0035CADB6C
MALSLPLAACSQDKASRNPTGPPAGRLARTLDIVRTATPSDPKVLKLLFYGQSITSTKWTDRAVAHLARRYPDTRFVARNMAIGGFSAKLLERTAGRDVAEFYPDLIVFHAYGNDKAYERIVRLMRSITAAEIIVETDHIVLPAEPICREGLHLTLTPPPGCKGRLWYRQRNWEDHMSGVVIPALARKYGLAIEPRRRWWGAYLRRTRLPPKALLEDDIHPNDAGWRLAAAIFTRWFDAQAASWRGEGTNMVRTLAAPPAGRTRRYTFTGNRVELIAAAALGTGVAATIDGKNPADIDGCWQTSRTTVLPGVPTWPAIRQVRIDPGLHRAERWTATLTGISPRQDRFHFNLAGAATGPDGDGDSDRDFVSPSGRVRIDASDWVVPAAFEFKGVRTPENFKVGWERRFVCFEQRPVPLARGREEVRFVVATGLVNGRHTLDLRLSPAAAAATRELRVYRPPLNADGR